MSNEELDRQVVWGLFECMGEESCTNIRIHEICRRLPNFSYGDKTFTAKVRRSLKRLHDQGMVDGRGYGGGFYYVLTPAGLKMYELELPEARSPKALQALPQRLLRPGGVSMAVIKAMLSLRTGGLSSVELRQIVEAALRNEGLDPAGYYREPFRRAIITLKTNGLVDEISAGSHKLYRLTDLAVSSYGDID